MSYAAQCLVCQHQIDRHNLVVGCKRFENGNLDGDTASVMAALLYQNAERARCPGFTKLVYGRDAYRALDLPEKTA